ncbi:cytochrome P450 2G1-like isoform X3 [Rhinatrema bivittatum]|uniref:cytochrome P450 2G1-like isoform X3 n=1 Tax=Rhinatrema bivittatum TaxID=194408 RepID=UPI00112C2034|nr:cytochrome P450 2G1-like isoform X3 [Rhinatrema bivittatum]
MELGEAATLLLAFCITCLLLSAWRRRRSQRLPPGPFPLPILGNALNLVGRSLPQALKELGEKYGPVYSLYMGSSPMVVVSGLPAVKEALLQQGDAFSGRGPFPVFQHLLKDYGVGLSSGERWKQLRRFSLMTLKSFGMGKRSIEERIQEEAQYLVEEFRKTRGVPFNPSFLFGRAVANIICSVIFGDRFVYEDPRFLSLLELVDENFHLLNTHWSQESASSQHVFALENLVSSTIGIFLAGIETVNATLQYGFLILQKYPEIIEKIHTELDLVIGRERLPCMEDRKRMPYTEAVIHEIQRFTDVNPMGLPRATIVDTNFRGYIIPKGTTVFFLLTTVLNDPTLFERPETFNPAHFLDERGCFRKSEAFVPFSIGKRNCLGEGLARMELFLFFVSILQSFTLKPTRDPKDIDLEVKISNGIGLVVPPYQFSLLPR